MSITGWRDKQNVVYTYSGILLSLKREGNPVICYSVNMWIHEIGQSQTKTNYHRLFSCSVMSDSLWPHGLLHTVSLSFTTFQSSRKLMFVKSLMPSNHLILCCCLSCPQSYSASASFPMSQLFVSSSRSILASASVLLMNIQGWFPLGLTGLISLLSEELSRLSSSTSIWKHQFFSIPYDSTSLRYLK